MSIAIVYVDDDIDDIFFFKEAVSIIDSNIIVTSFTDGDEALSFLHNTPSLPNYVFLDNNMPRKSGMEILKAIKNDHRLNQLPVIMYSTSNEENEMKEFYNWGATAFIKKHDSVSGIEKSIAEIIRK